MELESMNRLNRYLIVLNPFPRKFVWANTNRVLEKYLILSYVLELVVHFWELHL